MDRATKGRFLKFSGVGVITFLVDAAVFQALCSLANASPYAARVASFLVATTAAWWLNRVFTFRDGENARPDLQWVRFLAVNMAGGGVNYVVFAALIAAVPLAGTYPILALTIASLCAVSFNFTAYRRYVFRTDPQL